MAGLAQQVATGITITFANSDWTADITDIEPVAAKRERLETSNQATVGGRTWTNGKLTDYGEWTIKGHYNPAKAPPLAGSQGAENVTIQFPVTNGGTHGPQNTGSAFFTEFKATANLDKVMEYEAKLTWTGNVTFVDEA